jgi:ketosteroid isomerase-like protein
MSQENVESEARAVVRAFFDLVVAGDLARVSDSLDPDVVWFGTRGGLDEEQVVSGREAVLNYMREIAEPWESLGVEVERLIEIGDAVVVFLRETAHARQSDLEVQNRTAMILKVRQQRIVEGTGYLDRNEALEALGLSE